MPSSTRRASTLAARYSERPNSLNLLRLVFALVVVASHDLIIGGFGDENVRSRTTIGYIAVQCFFAISGFLIARSALVHSFGRFLWLRCIRIMPAFWAALIAVSFGFGILGWYRNNAHATLGTYLVSADGPVSYVSKNFFLTIHQQTIANTLAKNPWPFQWNGSLWTLRYEFICYLIVGVLAAFGVLRRRWATVAIACVTWATLVVVAADPVLSAHFTILRNYDQSRLLAFGAIFIVGAAVQRCSEWIPDSALLAALCLAGYVASFFAPLGRTSSGPLFVLTSVDMAAPLLVYPVLWLGAHLPGHRIGARNDYSYGIYLFGFPTAQGLVLLGAQRHGYVAFLTVSVLATGIFAFASWHLVEWRAITLRSWDSMRWLRAELWGPASDVWPRSQEERDGSTPPGP